MVVDLLMSLFQPYSGTPSNKELIYHQTKIRRAHSGFFFFFSVFMDLCNALTKSYVGRNEDPREDPCWLDAFRSPLKKIRVMEKHAKISS